MNKITLAQREALDVVKDMIDRSNTSAPDYGTKIITLILGILNVDCRVEHTITQIDGDKITPIIPDNGNDKINIGVPNWPDWIKPTPPFVPGDRTSEPAPWEQRIWYNNETEPIDAYKHEERMYATEVSCTGDKNGIVYTTNTADVQYNGYFKDVQTSFNDK